MINLLLGAPGGGKSYEAVAFHILPAVKAGRKVVTNLPLDLEAWAQLDPDYPELIEIRQKTLAVRPSSQEDGGEVRPLRSLLRRMASGAAPSVFRDRAFANPEDYCDPWRHPKTGVGPLYVVDEAHLCLPFKNASVAVEEWYSMHRHYNVDVLLISQSYGKVSKPIIDLVQVVYRVRKAVAFGSMTKYIRKVQDGIRGDVVNTSVREYKLKYQQLYKSHTHGRPVEELGAQDIVPLWRRWPVLGAVVCLVVLVGMLASGKMKSPMRGEVTASRVSAPVSSSAPVPGRAAGAQSPVPSHVVQLGAKAVSGEPFEGRGLHLVGLLATRGVIGGLFLISQNGQQVGYVRSRDLVAAGYVVRVTSPCTAVVAWKGREREVICDFPQVAPSVGGGASASVRGT